MYFWKRNQRYSKILGLSHFEFANQASFKIKTFHIRLNFYHRSKNIIENSSISQTSYKTPHFLLFPFSLCAARWAWGMVFDSTRTQMCPAAVSRKKPLIVYRWNFAVAETTTSRTGLRFSGSATDTWTLPPRMSRSEWIVLQGLRLFQMQGGWDDKLKSRNHIDEVYTGKTTKGNSGWVTDKWTSHPQRSKNMLLMKDGETPGEKWC